MVAADWYGVQPDADLSARTLQLSPTLDKLDDTDAEIIEILAARLASAKR